jgi:hypothetical protein
LSFKLKYSSSLSFKLKFVIQVHSYILKFMNHIWRGAPEQRWAGRASGMEAGADVEDRQRPGVVAGRSGASGRWRATRALRGMEAGAYVEDTGGGRV